MARTGPPCLRGPRAGPPRTVVSIPQRLVRLSGKRARRLKEQDIDETLRNTPDPRPARHLAAQRRSEEQTSELQSIMRISYAVICLKKKQYKTTTIKSS